MMGKMYAQTEIRYGKVGDDGVPENVVYEEGEEVSQSDFDEDTWEQLRESKSVAETPPKYDEVSTDAEIRSRDDRIQELEAALSKATGGKSDDSGAVKPAGGQQAAADKPAGGQQAAADKPK